MIIRPLIVLAVVVTVALATAAQEPRTAKAHEGTSDVQDILFLGDRGPVKIRLHLRVEGRPFSAAWDDYMQALFNYADLDGNGTLDEKEARLIPSSSFLAALMAGGFSLQTTSVIASFKELDSDGDGKVTLAEMKNYFIKAGLGPIQLHVSPGEGASQSLTDALFKALDQNKDGKLSKEEIEKAEESLKVLDVNEEDLILPERLVPPPGLYGAALPPSIYNATPAKSRVSDFVLLSSQDSPERQTERLLSRYAKSQEKSVAFSEIGLEKALFERLDVDKNGKLDGKELVRWFAEPATVELVVQVGRRPEEQKDSKTPRELISRLPSLNQPLPAGNEVHRTGEGSMVMKLGNALIEMQCEDVPSSKYEALRRFNLQQFRGARGDEKHLTSDQGKNNTFLAGLFPLADRNGDGQLSESELEAFFELHSKGPLCFITFSIGDHGYGLFELLDTNHDNRLSLRELKAAWKVLEPWDANKDGFISANELPRQFQITLSQGPKVGNARFALVGAPRSRVDLIQANGKKGPVWFRKMDRNGDGDVSRREFLGSDEDFRRIDADGDGLISLEEAEKADEWYRKRQK